MRFFTAYKKYVLGLLLAAFLVLLPIGSEREPPETVEGGHKVLSGVMFDGEDYSGLTRADVIQRLEAKRLLYSRPPVNSAVDPITKGLLPGVDGYELDVNLTADRILSADLGEVVEPAYRVLSQHVKMSDYPLLPIYQGNPLKKQVTFVVNVAWGNEHLSKLLGVLRENGVHATFFLVGKWAESHPGLARAIADAGHEIANHGYETHENLKGLSQETLRAEILKAQRAIRKATGRDTAYLSPHKGELTGELLSAAAESGHRMVLWSLDTADWMRPGVQAMSKKILDNVHNGAIILMHPTEQTPEALEIIISGLRKKGYAIVCLSTLLSPSPPEL